MFFAPPYSFLTVRTTSQQCYGPPGRSKFSLAVKTWQALKSQGWAILPEQSYGCGAAKKGWGGSNNCTAPASAWHGPHKGSSASLCEWEMDLKSWESHSVILLSRWNILKEYAVPVGAVQVFFSLSHWSTGAEPEWLLYAQHLIEKVIKVIAAERAAQSFPWETPNTKPLV